MFDFVQDKRWLVQIVLAVIILTFAVWGISSYQNTSGSDPLATVNGEKIGQQEFEDALEQQRQRIREMAGASFDPTFFDKPEIKRSVLEGLVAQRVLTVEARGAGLMPGDEQLAQIIAGIGVFQKDGKFDIERYEAALKERGMNRLGFEARLRQDVAARQITDAYSQNGYAANTVAETLIRLNEQQRIVAVSSLNPETYLKQVQISDADIAAYYEKNANEFQLPERANVEYVMFSADSLSSTITVADSEVKQYYEEHAAEFGTKEQRQAAHILIAVAKQASDAEKLAAKAKAEQVLQQVKQSPAKFPSLAKQYSQDPGSAANGGDLGMFGRGAMVKPFEESVFSLKAGEVSGLVQSDYGYHIIKLLAVKAAKMQPLGEVRGMIVQRLKSQHAGDKFAELADQFNNTVYEQSDTLKPAAELVKATVLRGVWLSKGQAANDIWTDKALQAVFSEDVLKNKRNTAAIEIATNTLLAARVVEYKPASARPMAEVAQAIRQSLQSLRAAEMAEQQGKEILARLQRGEKAGVNWKPAQSMSRSQRSAVAPELLQAVFSADTSKLPAYSGVASSRGGYLLARIEAVKETGAIDDGKRNGYVQQIRQLTGEELLMAYLADAKKRADITMKEFVTDERK
ncbi:MAG: SurA N-terminal domain-containing protein [Nitrosomonadales bacterium]|nr:SurA N-terminal domain-containing protein [Nitrosomonadales bacterium]